MSCPGQPNIKLSPNIFIWKAEKNLVLLAKSKTKKMVYSWFGDIICITHLHRASFCFAFEDSHIMHYSSTKISQCALITHICMFSSCNDDQTLLEINFLFETSVWSGISRKEKGRRYVKKFDLFIYNYIINYIYQMHFLHFIIYLSECFIDFFQLRLIEKILSSTIM